MSPAIGRARKRNSSKEAGAVSARLFLFVLVALAAVAGYGVYSGFTVYQELDSGRRQLLAGQAHLSGTGSSLTAGSPEAAAEALRQAELDFEAARSRGRGDIAFRLAASLPAGAQQVDATARLGAIGADISRAGRSASVIAVQLEGFNRQYAGRALTPAELPSALSQAQAIAGSYADSSASIAAELRAAHAERAAVKTQGLLPPLRDAYAEVDVQLAQVDAALARYQDLRKLLAGLLGVALP